MNYQELKNAIIEVIRTNGNEEITGEVLQFVLLEMVSSLGKDFQFAGVATPQTEIIERDDKVAWVLGAGTYENFGIPFTVAVDEIAFVLYNGTYRVQKVKTGVIVDDTLTRDGQNPVKGGAIYAEFEKLRAAGYLFAGVATPSLLPPANLTEKIFYLATQGGEYPNLDNITLQKGINIIRFDGTSWIGESLIAITDEVIDSNVSLITAAGVYNGLSGKVDKAEGMGLSQNSYTNTEKSKLGALPTAQELVQMLGGKQDVLTFDTTPTLNSQNPVTSDGIQRAIEAIIVLIPSAASALNQLADKSFVNSTVATASATFRGTYNLVSDLSLAVTATHAQIAAALAGAVSGADNNDYCFVQIPTSAGTPTEIRVTERYKFNGTAWAYEYDLNNSGFTAAQWEAINSGITALLVTKLSNLPYATELTALFAGKQNTLTFDNAPVSGSSNPVKSGGIYDAIAAITAVIPSTATSSNKLVDLNALTAYMTGIIGALDASFDLTSTDGHVTLKMTQVDGVITTLQILTSDIASAQALTTLSCQVSTNADDIAALQALYNALQQSAPQVIEPADTWPVANPSDTVIYRVIDRVNTPPQYYSDYMFKADDLTTPVLMATYNNAIDAVPTAGSHNLVESGGVQNELALGAVYDVSAKNPTAGPNYDGKFESLAALLSDANLNTLIPDAYRKGGMSIKFVQSSDNKYVQYRLMATTWSTTVTNWQGVDDEPVAGSDNLVKSGGVATLFDSQYGDSSADLSIEDEHNNAIVKFEKGGIKTKGFDSDKTPEIQDSTTDFDFRDENGNIILAVIDQEVKTKKFDSSKINKTEDGLLDFAIADEDGAIIFGVKDGYPKTKNFDGKEVSSNKGVNSDYLWENVDANNPLSKIRFDAGMTPTIRQWGFLGDSLSSGAILWDKEGGGTEGADMYEYSWGQHICRLCNVEGFNFSFGGATAKSWLTHSQRGWPVAQVSDNLKQAYTMAFGINDAVHIYDSEHYNEYSDGLGDADTDLVVNPNDEGDYSQNNENTFVGCYGGIIQRLKSVQPRCRIFLLTMLDKNVSSSSPFFALHLQMDAEIRKIAAKFDNVYVIDLAEYGPQYYGAEIYDEIVYGSHLTTDGYLWLAYLINTYIDWIIRTNVYAFRDIALIGTDHYMDDDRH